MLVKFFMKTRPKRRSIRVIKRLEVKFCLANVCYTEITSNFSEHGLFIRTKKGLTPGTLLKLQLHLPSGKILNLSGLVKKTIKTKFQDIKNGMGIELTNIPPEYLEFLKSIQ